MRHTDVSHLGAFSPKCECAQGHDVLQRAGILTARYFGTAIGKNGAPDQRIFPPFVVQSLALTIGRVDARRRCLVLRDGVAADREGVGMRVEDGRMTLTLDLDRSTDLVLAWELK